MDEEWVKCGHVIKFFECTLLKRRVIRSSSLSYFCMVSYFYPLLASVFWEHLAIVISMSGSFFNSCIVVLLQPIFSRPLSHENPLIAYINPLLSIFIFVFIIVIVGWNSYLKEPMGKKKSSDLSGSQFFVIFFLFSNPSQASTFVFPYFFCSCVSPYPLIKSHLCSPTTTVIPVPQAT